MKTRSIAFVAIAIITTLAVYFFIPVGTQKDNNTQGSEGGPQSNREKVEEEKVFTIEEYTTESNSKLPKAFNDKASQLLQTIENSSSTDVKAQNYTTLAGLYAGSEKPEIAAYYIFQKAKLLGGTKALEQAGDNFISLYTDEMMDNRLRKDVMNKAIESYRTASNGDTGNLEVKVKLAQCFMEGTGDVMSGVTLLKNVTERDSNHYGANLLLGKFGIISGQYEKAIHRLEKVISLQSQKIEAYFLLADAYAGMGNNVKAIEVLEKALPVVKDKALKAQIETAVKQLKAKVN